MKYTYGPRRCVSRQSVGRCGLGRLRHSRKGDGATLAFAVRSPWSDSLALASAKPYSSFNMWALLTWHQGNKLGQVQVYWNPATALRKKCLSSHVLKPKRSLTSSSKVPADCDWSMVAWHTSHRKRHGLSCQCCVSPCVPLPCRTVFLLLLCGPAAVPSSGSGELPRHPKKAAQENKATRQDQHL